MRRLLARRSARPAQWFHPEQLRPGAVPQVAAAPALDPGPAELAVPHAGWNYYARSVAATLKFGELEPAEGGQSL